MADIEYRIDEAPLIDTHEHLWGEATYTDAGLDILRICSTTTSWPTQSSPAPRRGAFGD